MADNVRPKTPPSISKTLDDHFDRIGEKLATLRRIMNEAREQEWAIRSTTPPSRAVAFVQQEAASASTHASATSQPPPRPDHRTVRFREEIEEVPRTPATPGPLTIHSDDLFPEFKDFEFDFQPEKTSAPYLSRALYEIYWSPSDMDLMTIDFQSAFR
jgi:hypothetical protein